KTRPPIKSNCSVPFFELLGVPDPPAAAGPHRSLPYPHQTRGRKMTLPPFYPRALALLAVSLILGLIIRFWPDNPAPAVVAPSADTIAAAEKRLANLREVAATVGAKDEIAKK